jgi:hypothetical protein
MKKENKLPKNWCVRNDGSELFQNTVAKWLNERTDRAIIGLLTGAFYGVKDNDYKKIMYTIPFYQELTIEGFIELSGIDYFKEGDGIEESKKIVKMSLESAREIYKQMNTDLKLGSRGLMKWILENFTKEELEGNGGFVWEDCWPLHGYYFDNHNGFITGISGEHLVKSSLNKHVFATEKQALSSVAFAQLTHIVNKYNEGKKLEEQIFGIEKTDNAINLSYMLLEDATHLYFYTEKDAEQSLITNRQLWRQYWML